METPVILIAKGREQHSAKLDQDSRSKQDGDRNHATLGSN
jgi:hypothetical protein